MGNRGKKEVTSGKKQQMSLSLVASSQEYAYASFVPSQKGDLVVGVITSHFAMFSLR